MPLDFYWGIWQNIRGDTYHLTILAIVLYVKNIDKQKNAEDFVGLVNKNFTKNH